MVADLAARIVVQLRVRREGICRGSRALSDFWGLAVRAALLGFTLELLR